MRGRIVNNRSAIPSRSASFRSSVVVLDRNREVVDPPICSKGLHWYTWIPVPWLLNFNKKVKKQVDENKFVPQKCRKNMPADVSAPAVGSHDYSIKSASCLQMSRRLLWGRMATVLSLHHACRCHGACCGVVWLQY